MLKLKQTPLIPTFTVIMYRKKSVGIDMPSGPDATIFQSAGNNHIDKLT